MGMRRTHICERLISYGSRYIDCTYRYEHLKAYNFFSNFDTKMTQSLIAL